MSMNAHVLQNDKNKKNGLSVKQVECLNKPSLLKDPKTLFGAYSSDTIPSQSVASSSNNKSPQFMARKLFETTFFEDTLEANLWGGLFISNDQQLTWLIPAVAHLERIKNIPLVTIKNDNYFKHIIVIVCLYVGTLMGLRKMPARNWSKK